MSTVDEYSEPVDASPRDENPWPAQPLPVVNATQREAPEFGSFMTWTIPQNGVGTNAPVQVLQRRIKRYKAKLTLVALPTVLTTVTAPAVPASGTPQYNNFGVPVIVTVTGGTVSAIAVNGTPTGLTSGAINVPANGTITLTYTVAPTWTWQTSGTGSIVVNSKLDPLNLPTPQGGTYQQAGVQFLEYDAEQPLYVTAIGGSATVTVVDEAFGSR